MANKTVERLFAALLSILLLQTCEADQLRGVWVDAFGPGFLDGSQVRQLASDCRQYNFNAVFVQMRKRGDAFYLPKPPNADPRAVEIERDFDALAEIIKECHDKEPRIQVHCWLVGYFVWAWDKPPPQKEHIYNRHPEYFTRDSIGQRVIAKGYYLDPGHPEVGASLHNIAKDIAARYDIDGLHWDYLRYPERDSGYNEIALARYKTEFSCTESPAPADPRFCQWRCRQITDFLRWSSAELLAQKPELIISAAVFSNYQDSRDNRFSDWVAWNKEGILDVSIPMDFSSDNKFVFEPRAHFALSNQWNRAVWVGQGSYMNTREGTLKQLQFCAKQKANGAVLYCYRKPADGVAVVSDSLMDSFPEPVSGTRVIVDNLQAQKQGPWNSGAFGKPWGKDYLCIPRGNGQNWAYFAPKLPVSGTYLVCEWHVSGLNRATDASFFVIHNNGTNVVRVNQQLNGSRWNSLGTFYFETNAAAGVQISDESQGGGDVIVADAIRFSLISTSNENGAASGVNLSKGKTSKARRSQRAVFDFLKRHYQPGWQETPALAWKKNLSKAILRGAVRSRDGEPIYNATVQLLNPSGQKQLTEPHGRFAFFDLAPGTYRIQALHNGLQAEQKINLHAGQSALLNLTLESAR